VLGVKRTQYLEKVLASQLVDRLCVVIDKLRRVSLIDSNCNCC